MGEDILVSSKKDLTSDPVFRSWLKDMLEVDECKITFTKTDGTERVMRCTLEHSVVSKYVKKTDRKSENSESIRVWDLDKNDWRTVKFDSIKEISFTIGTGDD